MFLTFFFLLTSAKKREFGNFSRNRAKLGSLTMHISASVTSGVVAQPWPVSRLHSQTWLPRSLGCHDHQLPLSPPTFLVEEAYGIAHVLKIFCFGRLIARNRLTGKGMRIAKEQVMWQARTSKKLESVQLFDYGRMVHVHHDVTALGRLCQNSVGDA